MTSRSRSSFANSKDKSDTKATDRIEQIKAYETAHNSYDVDAALSRFAKHAVLNFEGLVCLQNDEAIRRLHEYDRAIHAQIEFQDFKVVGNQVSCAVVEKNDWLTAAGLETIYYPSSVFTLTQSGKIQEIAATVSTKDGAAINAILTAFVPWLMRERPREANRLFNEAGDFVYSWANGALVITLLAQWRMSG